MTLVHQASLIRKRIRRDGAIEILGLTDRVSGAHWLMWRIGTGLVHDTKDLAIAAANGRVGLNPDRKTVLDGEIVTPEDCKRLHETVIRRLTSGLFTCHICRSGDVYRAAMCLSCYRSETGDL